MDISSINSDLIRGNVTTIILKALLLEDRYGYDILREIEVKSEGQYKLKQPTLYSCLKRLEKQGLISSYWGDESDTEGGRRRYYTLTETGKKYINQMQSEYEYSRTILDKLLSKNEFDFETKPAPFNINNLRPYTKRKTNNENDITASKKIENEKNIDIKKLDYDCNENIVNDSIHISKQNGKQDNVNVAYDIKGSSYDTSIRNTGSSVSEMVNEIDNIIDIKENKITENNKIEEIAKENLTQHNFYRPEILSINEEQTKKPELTEQQKKERKEARLALGLGQSTNYDNKKELEDWKNKQIAKTDNDKINISKKPSFIDILNEKSLEKTAKKIKKEKFEQLEFSNIINEATIKKDNKKYIKEKNLFSFKKDEKNVCNYLDTFSNLRKTSELPKKNDTENIVQQPASNIDLKTKLYSAGYKVRPYSRENTENYYSLNFLHSNKLNRDCYAILYLFLIIELIIGKLILKEKFDSLSYIAVGAFGILIPAIPYIFFTMHPDKRIRANFNFKTSILNRMMLFLNLVVVVCLVGFFGFGANINNTESLLAPIIIPIILLLNIPISSIIYLILYNSKKYHVS